MTSTKTRKQGNSLVITIPATFVILRKNNGSIALIPKVEDFLKILLKESFIFLN